MEAALAELTPLRSAAQHFHEDGYVVVPGLISQTVVDAVGRAWRSELKPNRRLAYRQTSGVPERNQFDRHGHVMNPLWNVQSMDRRRFPRLPAAVLDAFAEPAFRETLTGLVGSPPGLVQSMLFEGNPATPAHQDLHYLDAVDGQLVAAWVALEDIHPDAGRFFVYPGSHRVALAAVPESGYLPTVAERIADLTPYAPALSAGDVLFWHPATIHGSLPTVDPACSRLSMTGHFIPTASRIRYMERVVTSLRFDDYRGLGVHRPKDQNTFKGRARMSAETLLPMHAIKRALFTVWR